MKESAEASMKPVSQPPSGERSANEVHPSVLTEPSAARTKPAKFVVSLYEMLEVDLKEP